MPLSLDASVPVGQSNSHAAHPVHFILSRRDLRNRKTAIMIMTHPLRMWIENILSAKKGMESKVPWAKKYPLRKGRRHIMIRR
jgi:hypothetical protein